MRFFYAGAILHDPNEQAPNNPDSHELWMIYTFEDEPAGNPAAWTDCTWEAASCDAQEDEGELRGTSITRFGDTVAYTPWAAPHDRCYAAPFSGVAFKAAPRGGGAHYEMRANLRTSPLNNVGEGDCFDLRWLWVYLYTTRPNASGDLSAGWPAEQVDRPDYSGQCTVLCLAPCEVEEEFVPEPASIMLLGGGLAGLAGYATLRWRTRE